MANRPACVAGAVLVAVALAGCAPYQSTGTGATRSGTASATPASARQSSPSGGQSPAPGLDAVLDALSLPPGAVERAVTEASQNSMEGGTGPRTVHRTRYWTSTRSRTDVVAWLEGHPEPGLSGGFDGTIGNTTSVAQYVSRAGSTVVEGPNLNISVADRPEGSGILADAYETPLAQKVPAQQLVGVTGVTATLTSPVGGPALGSVRWGGVKAAKVADEVNSSPVDPGFAHGCTAGQPLILLDFASATGDRLFTVDRNCDALTEKDAPSGAAPLNPSSDLLADIAPLDQLSHDGLVALSLQPTRGAEERVGVGQYDGTVLITQQGRTVRTVQLTAGRQTIIRLPTGDYTFTATSAGRSCTVATSSVERYQETGVDIVCRQR